LAADAIDPGQGNYAVFAAAAMTAGLALALLDGDTLDAPALTAATLRAAAAVRDGRAARTLQRWSEASHG
jgi:hypothetical protein